MRHFKITIFLILILFTSCNQYTTENIESLPEEYQGKFFFDNDGYIDEHKILIIGSDYVGYIDEFNDSAKKIFIKNITLSKNKSKPIFIIDGDVEEMYAVNGRDDEFSEIPFYNGDRIKLKFSALISNKFKDVEFSYIIKEEQHPLDNSPSVQTNSFRR